MEIARLPENLPTPTNSFVILVVLCIFIFGGMAFAKFMEKRERKRLGNKVVKPTRSFQ
jgi:Na+/H+ antiporter NhaC